MIYLVIPLPEYNRKKIKLRSLGRLQNIYQLFNIKIYNTGIVQGKILQ